MKAPVQKLPLTSALIPKLFSSGTLRRAGVRLQPARLGRGVDSWLVFSLTRMAAPAWGATSDVRRTGFVRRGGTTVLVCVVMAIRMSVIAPQLMQRYPLQ